MSKKLAPPNRVTGELVQLGSPEDCLRQAQTSLQTGQILSAQRAFAEFVKQTEFHLLKRARIKPIPPGHEVRDVLQTVYVTIWKNLSRYDPARPALPWVYTVMRNVATDLYRQQVRKPRVGNGDSPQFDQLSWSSSRDEADKLDLPVYLSHLTPSEREAVECRYFRGLSIAETAKVLGIKPGTVGVKVHRALAKMRAVV